MELRKISNNLLFCAFLLVLISIPSANGLCSYAQNCTNDNDTTSCKLPYPIIKEPEARTSWVRGMACPDLQAKNEPVCCGDGQNTLMIEQFVLLNHTFGSGGDGCDVCVANLKRFWCHFTCSPRQQEFVSPGDYIYVEEFKKTVLSLNMTVHPDYACDLFQSCKTTPYVGQVSALQSAEGFLNFFGSQSAQMSPTFINMTYNSDEHKSLLLEVSPCDLLSNGTDQFGYSILHNCSCNTCDLMCGGDPDWEVPPKLEGLNVPLVVGVYGTILGFALICHFVVRRNNKRDEYEE